MCSQYRGRANVGNMIRHEDVFAKNLVFHETHCDIPLNLAQIQCATLEENAGMSITT